MTAPITRRTLLSLAGITGVGLVAAACSSDGPGAGSSTPRASGAAGSGDATRDRKSVV